MADLVTLKEIEAAARRLAGVAVRTPLVGMHGTDLLLKPESLQPVGSFKLRGAYATISGLPAEDRKRGVIAHSSGNHAQAVAYAANVLGIPAVLVVPHTTPAVKVDACRALGAEIVFVEPTIEARIETAERLALAHGYVMVPPFDDRRIIAGQGTVGLEIVADASDVEVVLVPISGGGLASGVAAAVKAKRPHVRVIGVEPELAADARDSLRAGHPVAWDPAKTAATIADALRVERVGDLPFAHLRTYVDGIITVTDDEIREAIRALALRARLVAEPGGAVTVAAHLFHRGEIPGGGAGCVAVVSGGNVDPTLLAEILGAESRGRPEAPAARG